MANKTIGIAVSGPDAATALSTVRKAERLGVRAAWVTSGGAGGDGLTVMAAAAAQTKNILLGTSIMQTWSRHPVAAAQQVQVIASLAPGRFRFGIGPGHQQPMTRTFGAQFSSPLGHLKEYIRILKGLLQQGTIDLDGQHYAAHAKLPGPVDVPVMASALRAKSFELCGSEADGAISWVCPHNYLRDVALPALRAGARKAGRPAPPMVVHAPVCVNEDVNAVRGAVREQLSQYPRIPFYAGMFAAAGFPRSGTSGWTDAMLDSVVIWGNETEAAKRLEQVFAWGASEVLASIVTVGRSKEKSAERTMRLLAEVSA